MKCAIKIIDRCDNYCCKLKVNPAELKYLILKQNP